MTGSKKMLVAFNVENSGNVSSDFLIPVFNDSDEIVLIGTCSGKVISYGLVILTGQEVTENDLFAKLIDSGRKIISVDNTLLLLSSFIEEVKNMKIGNVVKVGMDNDGVLTLSLVSSSPSGFNQ